VGGKTGVNHKLGKNMIGAFKQPNAVFIDSSTLTTLPKSEFIAGFAEVIKHGLIFDESYFGYLEKHLEKILSLQPDVIEQVVLRSCEIKSSVVSKDETEQGIRAILNLGHTFGHAIETTMGYGKWLHGEAVGAGMVMAADLSARLGYLTNETVERIRDFITRSGLPSEVPNSMAAEDFMVAMARDKKVDAGKLKFILLRSLGEGFVAEDVPLSELNKTLNVFCKG
jgi:3-dehydroquinate synthase